MACDYWSGTWSGVYSISWASPAWDSVIFYMIFTCYFSKLSHLCLASLWHSDSYERLCDSMLYTLTSADVISLWISSSSSSCATTGTWPLLDSSVCFNMTATHSFFPQSKTRVFTTASVWCNTLFIIIFTIACSIPCLLHQALILL